MASKLNTGASDSLDMGALFQKYKRYWWLFALSIIGCLALAAFYLHFKKPVYLVTSSVIVEQENQSGTGAALLKSLNVGGMGGSKVDDEVIVISAQELICEMIDKLGLNRKYVEHRGFLDNVDHYNTSPLKISAPNELFDTLSTTLRMKVTVDKQGVADVKVKHRRHVIGEAHGQMPLTINTRYGIYVLDTTAHYVAGKPLEMKISAVGTSLRAEDFMEGLTVKAFSKKSNAMKMDVNETNVPRGKDVLNTMMDLYNEKGQAQKNETAINTDKFIADRLGLIFAELTKSEADIEAYKKSHKMVDAAVQAKSTITKQATAENARIKLETNYRIVNMIKEYLNNPANKGKLIPFSSDSTQSGIAIKEYNNLIMRRMELAKSATDESDMMRELDQKIEITRNQAIKGVNNALQALRIQLNSASAIDNSAQGEMGNFPTEERELRDLMRQQGIQNALYTFLLEKREENALLLAAKTPRGRIVDHAYSYSKPVSPKKPIVLVAALLLGLLLPLLLLYLKNLFTTKFRSQEELEDLVQAPVIGEICHNRHHSQLVVREGKTSSIVELFRLVRNNLQFMMTSEDDKVVLVTSSISGEGKSFVSTNVAASFAMMDKRVVLVGLDIRSPKLAGMVEVNEQPGVTAFLSRSSVTLDEVIQHVNLVNGLDVIVGGTIPPNPSELLLTDRMRQLFEQLRERYDVIIVDSAPIAMVSDSFSLAKYSDLTLFVTRANYTRRSLLRYFNSCLERGQLKNAAVVINDSNPRLSQGYGYGYGSKEDDKKES